MAILSFQHDETGLTGVRPGLVYIQTDNTLAEVVVPGYLNGLANQKLVLNDGDKAIVGVKTTPASTDFQSHLLEVQKSGEDWSLITGLLDEDDMASNDPNQAATQQSIKAYIDSQSGVFSGFASQQIFTADGTWTKPTNITKVIVQVIGGGGGGGSALGAVGQIAVGGGGASGAYAQALVDVSAISSVTITVGDGGAGGLGTGTNNGTDGGDSSFGTHAVAQGGAGGDAVTSTANGSNFATGGNGQTATAGDILIQGRSGEFGYASNISSYYTGWGGRGGNSFLGGARDYRATTGASGTGVGLTGQPNTGAGGGGAYSLNTAATTGNGGAGADGIIIVYEFY